MCPAEIDRPRAEAEHVASRSCCYVGARRDHDVHAQIDRAVRSLLPRVCRVCALRRLRTRLITRFHGAQRKPRINGIIWLLRPVGVRLV